VTCSIVSIDKSFLNEAILSTLWFKIGPSL